LLAACATDVVEPGRARVASVEVAPSTAPLQINVTLRLTATLRDSAGAPLTGRAVTWSSSDSTIAQVSSSGVVRGVSPGPAMVTATSEGKSGTAAISVTSGPAARLAFTTQPTMASADALLAPAVRVSAQDAQGNTATDFTGEVTIAIAANPGGGSLAGTTTVAAVAGVVTFADLRIARSGTGYTLRAMSGALATAVSGAFEVTPGVATHLVFTVQPSTTAAGVALAPAVAVTAHDAQGNVATSFTGAVNVTMGTNPGGTLSGTTTVTAAAGIATFTDLSIDLAGTGYTLVATALDVTGVTSALFDIVPAAASALVFTVQPGTTAAGTPMPAILVTALDAQGNTATGFVGEVTVGIGTNPAGGILSGTQTVTAQDGIAGFSTLSINVAGSGYSLSATASGLTAATSATFAVVPGAANALTFVVQPGSATAGAPIPALQVAARDAAGNTVSDFAGVVSVVLTAGAGAGGATLSGTTAVVATAGVATFADLAIDRRGTGYTLTASAPGLAATTSLPFAVSAGAATRLAFTVAPSTVTAGATMTPQVEIEARDAFGNTADAFTDDVTVTIGTNPSGGILSGRTAQAATGGVAVFGDLSIDRAGVGYTLSATAPALAGAASAAFEVTAGQADRLAFTVQPTPATAGASIAPAVQVTARDSLGNTVTAFTGTVALTITAGTGTAGATLSGTTTVAAVAGVATFATLAIDRSGLAYQLSATGTGEAGTSSAPFDIVPGAAAQLVFTAQPSMATAASALSPAVQVSARDALGNTATAFGGDVVMTIGTNPGGGTLSGVTTVAAVAGVAEFSDLRIDKSGSGYTLRAAAGALATATSAPIDVAAGPATRLVFTVHPSNTAVGGTITPAVVVTARDAQGNTATSFAGAVTVAIGTNPGGGTLSGTKTRTALAGVASYGDLGIDRAGTGYRLTAAATGLSSGTSSAFNIITPSGVVLVGAGDIADCSSSGDEATATLLNGISGTVFTAGDNAYPDGAASDFAQCYEPSWGRHKARTRPAPGNHDYHTSGASAYYGYFGGNAGPAGRGYYSYDLGDWHIVSLNSNISMSAGSAQETWLRADLAASTKRCTLAYWHHPRFSSSSNHGNQPGTQPLWEALYDAGAEIVISAHDHTYERFAPQTPTGTANASRGIREFVVGTGGRDLYGFGTPEPNSEVRNNATFGVLKLTLGSGTYAWQFVPVAGSSFTDSGTGSCH
jgi:hypothetical protein